MIVPALVRKEFLEIRRDAVTLAVAVVLPILLLFMFGYGMSLDVEDISLAVYDQDRSAASRRLIETFTASGYFRLHRDARSAAEVRRVLDRGEVRLAIAIPRGFERALARDETAEVQVIVDGAFSATALIVSNYAQVVIARHSQMLALERLAARGIAPPPHIRLTTRVWYNSAMKSVNYIVPGLFAVLLMAFPPMLTALSIVREKDRGTVEQIYVSPVEPWQFILGKIIPYGVIAFAEMLLVLAVGTLWFDIPFRGSLAFLLSASLLYVLVTVGIGVFVSTLTRSQVAAVLLSLVVTLMPSVLFSGFLFPISAMPYVLQLYTYVFPARYFMDVSRDIFLKGVGLEYLWGNVALLAAYALVLFALATLRFRKKIA